MWAQAGNLFTARVVYLGDNGSEQPTICSHSELRRLLHRRLEVLAAALRELKRLAASQPNAPEPGGAE